MRLHIQPRYRVYGINLGALAVPEQLKLKVFMNADVGNQAVVQVVLDVKVVGYVLVREGIIEASSKANVINLRKSVSSRAKRGDLLRERRCLFQEIASLRSQ